ncbi:MAG TPA: ATP-dependent DNA helicase UvrD2 [Acidimicrobiia bacterium]|nr:ATP-dependent DNA helicase UvrD2 [Acidimicrobiia bacterium]
MSVVPPRVAAEPARDLLLDDLDETQREAVTTDAAPLAILAGAGSGKTRVLTRRIAFRAREGTADPEHVLAITFTRKASGELRSRLARLGVQRHVTAGTVHAIALAQLRRRAEERGRTMPGVIERKVRLLLPLVGGRGPQAALDAGEIASEIEWAKARLVRPESYPDAAARARREPPRDPTAVAEIYARYEREKRRRHLLDFDDLIWWCADALESDAEFAAVQRWRFRHLFVDEFQDTSPAQFRLVRAWLGDRSDLCVVGDPNQAIYGFAGADAGLIGGFTRHFPGARVVQLGCNYRSTPQIVAVATALLADGGGAPRPAVRAVAEPGPDPTVTAYDDDTAEADGVAARLRAAHGADRPWSSMAVLYRVNAQSAAFEEALSRAGVPFRVRGAGRFLERPEVKLAIEELRRDARGAPGRPFAELLARLTTPAPNRLLDDRSEERREHVEALARLGHEYLGADGGPGSVDGFLTYLTTVLRDDAGDATDDAVELLTFHRAKGLEFATLFVTGLERGLVPITHAETPAERAEERRLLYVALTRAGSDLHLSYAKQRTMGTRTVRRQRSPWLAPIEEAMGISPAPRPPAAARDRLAAARDRLARTTVEEDADVDAHLFDALVEWRRNLARASGVPAYVIFHDATLKALATARPDSPDSLLAVAGIGPVKAQRYGEAILGLVGRHSG